MGSSRFEDVVQGLEGLTGGMPGGMPKARPPWPHPKSLAPCFPSSHRTKQQNKLHVPRGHKQNPTPVWYSPHQPADQVELGVGKNLSQGKDCQLAVLEPRWKDDIALFQSCTYDSCIAGPLEKMFQTNNPDHEKSCGMRLCLPALCVNNRPASPKSLRNAFSVMQL